MRFVIRQPTALSGSLVLGGTLAPHRRLLAVGPALALGELFCVSCRLGFEQSLDTFLELRIVEFTPRVPLAQVRQRRVGVAAFLSGALVATVRTRFAGFVPASEADRERHPATEADREHDPPERDAEREQAERHPEREEGHRACRDRLQRRILGVVTPVFSVPTVHDHGRVQFCHAQIGDCPTGKTNPHSYQYTQSDSGYTMPSVSARLPSDEKEELDAVADLLDEDRSTTIRKALREGLAELRVRRAVEQYQSGEASVGEAARIAGVSLGEWLEIAAERNLTTQLRPADLSDDAYTAQEL